MKKLLLAILIVLPLISGAQGFDYTPLAPIPQITEGADTVNVSDFIPGAITLGIGIAGALSVIFIMIGGIQYMTTDAYSGKSDGKETIRNAIFGLLLAIGSYAILYTIDEDLVRLDLNITGVTQGRAIDPDGVNTTTNAQGENLEASLEGCNDCVQFPPGVLFKPAAANGCKLPGPCVINRDLGFKLLSLTQALRGKEPEIIFQVTESWPPTRPHNASCQQHGNDDSGKCVDANFAGGIYAGEGGATAIRLVREFIEESERLGLVSVYEVTTFSTRNLLVAADGIDPEDVVAPRMPLCSTQTPTVVNGRYSPACCPTTELRTGNPRDETCSWISANHFSVYLNNNVYSNR